MYLNSELTAGLVLNMYNSFILKHLRAVYLYLSYDAVFPLKTSCHKKTTHIIARLWEHVTSLMTSVTTIFVENMSTLKVITSFFFLKTLKS